MESIDIFIYMYHVLLEKIIDIQNLQFSKISV